jgi:hypothetical protein
MIHVEFKGGLGDILYGIYDTGSYTQLEKLTSKEIARVTIISTNRGIKDLFEWHPKRDQIEVLDLEAIDPWDDEARKKYRVEPPSPCPGQMGPVKYHMSPADRAFLRATPSPYIVFSLSADTIDRNIPKDICLQAADEAIAAGFTVVTVGRNYESWCNWGGSRRKHERREEVLPARKGVRNAIDRLSVPGVMWALMGASASFCCDSSILLGSWRVGCPTFACYPASGERKWTEKWFCTFGRDFTTTGRVSFEAWRPKLFSEYLSTKARVTGMKGAP